MTSDCANAKRINSKNRKDWKVCDECNHYFVKEVERAFQARMEDEV